jgi:hypothetical protein
VVPSVFGVLGVDEHVASAEGPDAVSEMAQRRPGVSPAHVKTPDYSLLSDGTDEPRPPHATQLSYERRSKCSEAGGGELLELVVAVEGLDCAYRARSGANDE